LHDCPFSDPEPERCKTLLGWLNGTNVALTVLAVVVAYLGLVHIRYSTGLVEWTSKKDCITKSPAANKNYAHY
jgi:hypothetical protein